MRCEILSVDTRYHKYSNTPNPIFQNLSSAMFTHVLEICAGRLIVGKSYGFPLQYMLDIISLKFVTY